jgi:hypothetical protein
MSNQGSISTRRHLAVLGRLHNNAAPRFRKALRIQAEICMIETTPSSLSDQYAGSRRPYRRIGHPVVSTDASHPIRFPACRLIPTSINLTDLPVGQIKDLLKRFNLIAV